MANRQTVKIGNPGWSDIFMWAIKDLPLCKYFFVSK